MWSAAPISVPADSVPSAWWNLWLQWGGLYLLAAMAVALLLRRVMKVQ